MYVADQIISRGGEKRFDYGHSWNRRLHFVIPVCDHETWTSLFIRDKLEEVLSFASGDSYSFEFVSISDNRRPEFLNFPAQTKLQREYNEVVKTFFFYGL